MSDILIKGIEMPKNCLSCPLQGGTADCRLTQKTYNWGLTERPSDCPLIPVPPHGRLIEWISVKEKLPEVGKPVLCACRANIFEVMKMRTDGAWVHNDAVYDSTYMGGFVTHWAELPTIIPASKEDRE